MNRLSYLFAGLAAACGVALASTSALAQGIVVQPTSPTDVEVSPGEYYNHTITVKFDGFQPMDFYVERTINDLPDEEWNTAICMADLCYSATVSKTDPVRLMPGQEYKVKLTVGAGKELDETSRTVLKFVENGFGVSFAEIEFVTTTGKLSSVPTITITSPEELAFPNPALADITIPLTSVEKPQQVNVYNVMGQQVATFSDASVTDNQELHLNLSEFSAGLYHYTITGMKESRVGTFNVVK